MKAIPHILILVTIFLCNFLAFSLILNIPLSEPEKIWNLSLFFVSMCESIIVMLVINSFYDKPIQKLKLLIQKFYVGELQGKEIILEKNINQDINYIMTFFYKTLKTLRTIKEDFLHGKEIKGEVEIGKEIQGKMLKKKLLTIPSLNVVAKSKPAGEIGGDSYDIINQGDNYYIYVGDATGHGVGAGFIMIMVNALISGFSKLFISGAQIIANTNEILKPRVKANLLMSLLLIRWDEKNKKLFMTGAGHEYLMIYKHKLQKCFRVKSGGVALGMIKDVYKLTKEQQIQFEPGDIIVLYSDGITEAINQPKKDGNEMMYGEDRLERAIADAPTIPNSLHKSARTVFNHISIELSKFMGYKHVQLDDVTLAVIEYKRNSYTEAADIPLEIPQELMTEWKWEKH